MPGVATTNILPSRRLRKQKFAEDKENENKRVVKRQLVDTVDTILSETVIKSANSYLQISYFCSSNYFCPFKDRRTSENFAKSGSVCIASGSEIEIKSRRSPGHI